MLEQTDRFKSGGLYQNEATEFYKIDDATVSYVLVFKVVPLNLVTYIRIY